MDREPMFLADVENSPGSGPWAKLIQSAKEDGAEYPQIWHLFAFAPQATEHLARFTQEVMRGPSPLSAGMRELIAAFTSSRNQCPF